MKVTKSWNRSQTSQFISLCCRRRSSQNIEVLTPQYRIVLHVRKQNITYHRSINEYLVD
jgi:hypothetical protein